MDDVDTAMELAVLPVLHRYELPAGWVEERVSVLPTQKAVSFPSDTTGTGKKVTLNVSKSILQTPVPTTANVPDEVTVINDEVLPVVHEYVE